MAAAGLVGPVPSQGAAPAAVEAAAPPGALKYHKALRRRPAPGYLFDRFVDAWVDQATSESLEGFLRQRAEDSGADGLLLAYFYTKRGDDLRAIEQFRRTLEAEPGNAVAWYQKAVVEARSLDFEKALADLASAANAGPDEELATRITKLRGKLLVRSGKRDEAIAVLQGLVADNPADEELAEDVIELLVEEDLYDDAAKLSKQLIERTQDAYRKVLRRLRLGDIRQQAGDREAAVALYSDVLADVGAGEWLEREVLAQINRLYRREDDTGGLKKQYESLCERYPRRVAVLKGRARVLADSGDGEAALAKFREVLAITPGDRANQQEFVQLHLRAGDLAGARKQLEKLLGLYPKDAELNVQLAEVCAKLEDSERVESAVDRYLELSDQSEYAHQRAARLLDRLERPDAARAKYALLTGTFPESRSAKEAEAAFLYKLGDKAEAVDLWRAAADDGDVQQVVRIAKTLASRLEHEAAHDLLGSRGDEFHRDPMYLAQAVNAAFAVKAYDEAVGLARRRIALADAPAELEAAVAQAAKAIERSKRVEPLIGELQGLASPTPQQACLLAELYDRNGDSQRADNTLAPLVADGDPLAVSQQVRLARLRRDWDAAADAAERLLDLPGGRNSRNLRRLVELLERAYRIEEALKRLPEWKRLSPGSSAPWLTESRLLSIEGESEEAIEVLRRASRQLTDPRDVRSRLAQLYNEAGQLADAERIYWRDYQDSDDLTNKVRAVEQIARVRERQGTVAALVADFQERKRENRDSIEPLMALAAIHRVTNDPAKRIQALGEAAKLRPDDLRLLALIARAQEAEGDWEAARDTLARAAEADATQKTKQNLARLLIRWGETDAGYAVLRELVASETDDPRELEKVADAMSGAGDWDQAVAFLKPLADRFKDDYRLLYQLGVALEEDDQLIEAGEVFLAVLKLDEEPASAANAAAAGRNWYGSSLEKIAPPGLMDLLMATQQAYNAYAHRQNRGQGFYASVPGGVGRSTVSLPAKLPDAHSLALAHLGQLIERLDEEQAAAVREELAQSGPPQADAIFALRQEQPGGRLQIDPESLGDLLDRPAVRAFLTFSGNRTQGLDTEFFEESFRRFETDYPELALIAALNGVGRAETKLTGEHPLVAGVLRLLTQIDDPTDVTLMSVCQWRNGAGQMRANEPPEEVASALREWIVRRLPDTSLPQGLGPYLFGQVASIVRASDDPSAYVGLLERELGRHRGRNAFGGGTNQPAWAGRQPIQIAAPSFPPPSMRSVPAAVLGLLRSRADGRSFVPFADPSGNQPGWTDEAFLEVIGGVEDATLRLLLAHSVDDQALVEAAMEELLATDPPELDTFRLAAGLAAGDERPADAVRLLTRARFLPMNREERRQIDAQLVALVQGLDEKGEPDKELLQAGRDAALRLRHGRLDANLRQQLATAMEDFGLRLEAERLERAAPASTSGRAGAMVAGVARPQPVRADQIQRLIEAGKTEAAAKRVAQDLRSTVQQVAQNPWNRGYQIRQARDRINGFGLLDEAFKELDPGDSTSHRRHAEYGETLLLFGRPGPAAAAYRRALELRPREDAYRIKLMLAEVADDNRDAAVGRIPELGRGGVTLLAVEVSAGFNDYESPLDARFDQIELVVEAAERAGKQPKADLSWAPRFRQAVAGSHHSNRGSNHLGSLLGGRGKPRNPELAKRRATLHERLCRAMLARDEVACDAVAALWAAAEAADELGDQDGPRRQELLSLAADAVQRHRPVRSMNPAFNRIPIMNPWGVKARLQSPAELLVKRATATGDWSGIDAIQTKLESGGDPAMRRALEGLRALYECPEAEFAETATALIRVWRSRNAAAPGGENRPEMAVLDCYTQRGFETEIEPIFLGLLKSTAQRGGNLPMALLDYTSHLAERHGSAAAADWLERIAAEAVCPRDKRAAYVNQHYSQQGWQSGSPNGRIRMFEQFLNQATQRPELALSVVRFLSRAELGAAASDTVQMLSGRLTIDDPDDADAVLAFLGDTGLLGTAAELPLAPITGGVVGEGPTIAGLASEALNQVPALVKKRVRERLSDRDTPTLGVCLVLDSLVDPPERLHTLTNAAANLGVLQSLPDPQRGRVASRLATTLAVTRESWRKSNVEPDPGFATTLAWLDAETAQASAAITKRLETIERFNELGVEGHELDEWLAETLVPLVERDPAVAAGVYLKVCRLYDQAMAQGNVSMYYTNSAASELLQRMSWRWRREAGEDSIGLVELAVALHETTAEGAKIAAGSWDLSRVFEPLQSKWRTLKKKQPQADDDDSDAPPRIQPYYEWLDARLRGASSPLLAESHLRLFKDASAEEVEGVIAWLDAELASETPRNAVLARELRAAAGVAYERCQSGKSNTDFGRLPGRVQGGAHYDHYTQVLSDTERPLGLRTALAATLYSNRGRRLPTGVAHAVAETASAACQADYRLHDSSELSFCKNAYFLVVDDPADPVAEAFLGRWTDRFVKKRPQRTSRRPYPRSLNEAQSRDGLLMLVATRCLRDETDAATKVVKRYRSLLEGRHEVIALLARHDRLDDAARLARSSWSKLPLSTSAQSPVVYDSRLEQRVPALLEQRVPALLERLKGPLAYVVEAALARLPDPPEESEQPSLTRDDRMVAVADRFEAAGVTAPPMVESALVLFHESEAATDAVGEHLAGATARLLLPPLAQSGGDRFERAGALKRQHAKWATRQGEAGPALELLQELTSVDRNSNWQLWNYFQRHEAELHEALLDCEGDELEKVALAAREMLKKPPSDEQRRYASAVTLLTAAHLRLGKADESLAWFDGLDPTSQEAIRNVGLSTRDFKVFAAGLEKKDPDTLGARIDRLVEFLRVGEAVGWLRSECRGWPSLKVMSRPRPVAVWDAFFEEAEIPEAAIAIGARGDSATRIAMEVAALKLRELKRHADAVPVWEDTYNMTDGPEVFRWRYGVKWIEALLDSGQIADARQLHASVVSEKYPIGPEKDLYDALSKRITTAAEEAAQPETNTNQTDTIEGPESPADPPQAPAAATQQPAA